MQHGLKGHYANSFVHHRGSAPDATPCYRTRLRHPAPPTALLFLFVLPATTQAQFTFTTQTANEPKTRCMKALTISAMTTEGRPFSFSPLSVGSASLLRRLGWCFVIGGALPAITASAAIFYGTDDPTYHTSVSPSDPAYVPWQYEGSWGGFLGTAVGPRSFITANHVGGSVGQGFYFQGSSYTAVTSYLCPGTDLRIWQVDRDFSQYAPIYRGDDEVGRPLVVIGRGTQRGSEVVLDGQPQGWYWGVADGVQRWGENTVASAGMLPGYWQMISATFDAGVGIDEAHLSSGDSGGAVFIQKGAIWELAGINYGVDGPYRFTPGGSSFIGAIYDQKGLYDTGDQQLSGPGSFYATRISYYQSWVDTIVAVPEPNTMISAALLLLLIGASALRDRRKNRAA